MKFAFFFVAAVAAVQLNGNPVDSAKARESTLETSRKVVAAQNKFEADHGAMHAKNMAKAAADCQTNKDRVRLARSRQVAGGDQYPPMKTY